MKKSKSEENIMKNCKNCKHFDNTKPVSTAKGNDKHKYAEPYIGECKQTGRITLMNDKCGCFEENEND